MLSSSGIAAAPVGGLATLSTLMYLQITVRMMMMILMMVMNASEGG